jgi:glycopeptide antibiotics resistance protein
VAIALFVGAFFFPFAIEGMQYLLPMLGRRCDAADVIDNLIGLFLGGAIGLVVRLGSFQFSGTSIELSQRGFFPTY